MAVTYNTICLTQTAATVAALMDFPAPRRPRSPSGSCWTRRGSRFGGAPVERMLLYNPDAIAMWLFQKYTHLFAGAMLHSSLTLPMLSVMPSVTPVCFASMYTGVMPEVHGIRAYEKPVLKCETLFDAALAAGRPRGHRFHGGGQHFQDLSGTRFGVFYSAHAGRMQRKGRRMMERDACDLLVLYNRNYDSTMHRHGPESEQALRELASNANTFASFAQLAREAWRGKRAAMAFFAGSRLPRNRRWLGSHGLEMPEDMNIVHFYGFL